MEALTKRVERLEALVKGKKNKKEEKKITKKKLDSIMGKMFPDRPKLLSEEKKEEPKATDSA